VHLLIFCPLTEVNGNIKKRYLKFMQQLISYIALGAPATRRPATEKLPFLRPEIGFTPNWYHQALGIDFGEKWHTNPAYRKKSLAEMRIEIDKRFPGNQIGKHGNETT
jgi:hypothetical protein